MVQEFQVALCGVPISEHKKAVVLHKHYAQAKYPSDMNGEKPTDFG